MRSNFVRPSSTGLDVTVLREQIADEDALVTALRDAEAVAVMRERTPMTAALVARCRSSG